MTLSTTDRFVSSAGLASPAGWAAGIIGILAIGVLDWWTGVELRVFVFYYAPVAWLAWMGGRRGAWLATLLATAGWFASNLLAGRDYASPSIWAFNVLTQAASFGIVALLISSLRGTLLRERAANRRDPLTGLLNRTGLEQEAGPLLALCRRMERPVGIGYLDLDRFKSVNDRFGHAAGDALLRDVAGAIRDGLRPSDLAARMGGDEFVVLLPEAGEEETRLVLTRIAAAISEAAAPVDRSVGASAGGIVLLRAPEALGDAMRLADARMYEAKRSGGGATMITTVPELAPVLTP